MFKVVNEYYIIDDIDNEFIDLERACEILNVFMIVEAFLVEEGYTINDVINFLHEKSGDDSWLKKSMKQ